RPSVERVVAEAAEELVVPRTAHQGVVAVAAEQEAGGGDRPADGNGVVTVATVHRDAAHTCAGKHLGDAGDGDLAVDQPDGDRIGGAVAQDGKNAVDQGSRYGRYRAVFQGEKGEAGARRTRGARAHKGT